ncbi:hypothetical protein QN362_02220 [Actimicrobium sp. CCC2.4]|uniref:hypothetical protein n=1 Tax=Actimicrobium sp. CCC2.4 TaxID=3048606 RepID=UPI002AC93621|nr:hypothetical protein [Actimicrobium sp. CCC2.4]MEB0134139.1 hypothetical protein [Actimicrobium sp. CCC2.4]WPX32794.1 hypothetical protein RHM62_02780 [Actimicrobium sp. CCC2.4]
MMPDNGEIMTSRATEALFLKRCLTVAQTGGDALSADEANLFRLAAQLLRTNYPGASAALAQSDARYASSHPAVGRPSFSVMLASGLVRDLPRLRSMLEQLLSRPAT